MQHNPDIIIIGQINHKSAKPQLDQVQGFLVNINMLLST